MPLLGTPHGNPSAQSRVGHARCKEARLAVRPRWGKEPCMKWRRSLTPSAGGTSFQLTTQGAGFAKSRSILPSAAAVNGEPEPGDEWFDRRSWGTKSGRLLVPGMRGLWGQM